jgi:hypothetical protein
VAILRSEIHYDFPMAPWYPALQGIGAKRQWNRVHAFLSSFTDASPIPVESTLHLYTEPDTQRRLRPHVAEALRLFGARTPRRDDSVYGDRRYHWDLPRTRFARAVRFVAAGEPWPDVSGPACSLDFLAPFRLSWPDRATLLPHQRPVQVPYQGDSSFLYVSLGCRSHVWGRFIFPFPQVTPAFERYFVTLALAAPFTIDVSRLKHATLSPVGRLPRYRRISAAARSRLEKAIARAA